MLCLHAGDGKCGVVCPGHISWIYQEPCEGIFFKLCKKKNVDSRMNLLDIEGHRLKVKITPGATKVQSQWQLAWMRRLWAPKLKVTVTWALERTKPQECVCVKDLFQIWDKPAFGLKDEIVKFEEVKGQWDLTYWEVAGTFSALPFFFFKALSFEYVVYWSFPARILV